MLARISLKRVLKTLLISRFTFCLALKSKNSIRSLEESLGREEIQKNVACLKKTGFYPLLEVLQ